MTAFNHTLSKVENRLYFYCYNFFHQLSKTYFLDNILHLTRLQFKKNPVISFPQCNTASNNSQTKQINKEK